MPPGHAASDSVILNSDINSAKKTPYECVMPPASICSMKPPAKTSAAWHDVVECFMLKQTQTIN